MNQGNADSTHRLFHSGEIDPRPEFAANLFKNRCGARGITAVPPSRGFIEVGFGNFAYFAGESADGSSDVSRNRRKSPPQSRKADYVMKTMNRRFGETDSERARAMISPFNDSERDGGGASKITGLDSRVA